MAPFKEAMFSMKPDKCACPDGYNPSFYQHFWSLCGDEIFHECSSWLKTGFVPDRSILDNAIVAIEVVHYMKSKTKGKVGEVALKLDISKAYGRIDWDYLRGVMTKMGFSTRRNVSQPVKDVVITTLGVQAVLGTGKYLGLPSMIGRSKMVNSFWWGHFGSQSKGIHIGFGICIRDETGAFIRAKTEWVEPKCEVHVGETLGFLCALMWVHELNLGPVDFELDSKLVVDSF
ncbi:cytochrome p450, partial [Trifolium pratense]